MADTAIAPAPAPEATPTPTPAVAVEEAPAPAPVVEETVEVDVQLTADKSGDVDVAVNQVNQEETVAEETAPVPEVEVDAQAPEVAAKTEPVAEIEAGVETEPAVAPEVETEVTVEVGLQEVEVQEPAAEVLSEEQPKEVTVAEDTPDEGGDDVPVQTEEDIALAQAQQSLMVARESFHAANEKVLSDANEYATESGGDVIQAMVKAARDVQMTSSKKWYNFWERATRIPKDSKYEIAATGEKKTWKEIVAANKQTVLDIVAEEEGWKKVSNKNGVKVEYSPARSAEAPAAKTYRLTTTVAVPPQLLLLTQLRGPALGSNDPELVYMREHYNFVGGKTSLVHTIRKISSYESVSVRDFFDLTSWSEDKNGTITYTAQSVKALKGKIPKAVRGETVLAGLHLVPNEVGGTEITMVMKPRMGGWVPNVVLDWGYPGMLVQQLKNMESAAIAVREAENEEEMVKKFVYREIDE